MKIVTLGKRKGGVYASSCAVAIATAAAEEGQSVLLIDLNVQQRSLIKWGERRTVESSVEVVPATAADLPAMLRNLAGHEGLAVLDTSPHSDAATMEAYRASNLILAPCGPTIADLETMADVRDLHRLSKGAGKLSVVVTQYSLAQRSRADELGQALTADGFEICPARIRRLVAVPDAWALGLSAIEFEPKGEAAADARALWTYAKGLL